TSDSLQGFISHAAVLNAFSATASPQAPLSTPRSLRSNQKAHQSVVTEAVEVSDGEEPKHIPDRSENLLAKDLRSCKDIPPQSLIAPLPWKQWDHFCRVVAQIKHVNHITPSQHGFSNKWLLQLAEPQQWTSFY
ncbi:unnamed protein product, partial [Eruca vesicaria subsp. sativa]|nr:unnamed protein product [Eruca vesicaria subsp. sativa]